MKTQIAAVALVALLALTGCAGTTSEDAPIAATEGETAEPLTAEMPAASEDSVEQSFLDYVRESLAANTTIPDATDDQLLSAGAEACDRLAAGETSDTISVIDGEQPNGIGYFEDSGWIVSGARQFLCSSS